MIRDIRIEDYEAVDRLLLQLHKVHVNGRPELFLDIERFMSRDSFENRITDDEMIAILAEKNGTIVGCCFASILNHSGMVRMRTACIDQLVVDEMYRRKGIGRTLFQSVVKRAKKMGAKRVDLTVWGHNQPAISAYESYGMTPQQYVFEKEIKSFFNI